VYISTACGTLASGSDYSGGSQFWMLKFSLNFSSRVSILIG
jgi:hypothetical protein